MVDGYRRPVPVEAVDFGSCRLSDRSAAPKWRTWVDHAAVPLGKSSPDGPGLTFSVAPGEWIGVGMEDRPPDAIDITHVRAMFRLTGGGAREVLERLCALDLSEPMTPNRAAARTLVADVATELIRDDVDDEPSYLLLISRSFARHVWDRLVAVGNDHGGIT